jgi:hypothetical protein
MHLLRELGLGSRGLPTAACDISERGVKPGLWRRLVPLAEVDRFEVELREGEHEEPVEQLVLLTRSGKTLPVFTSRQESVGAVALRLNNELARYGAGPGVHDAPVDGLPPADSTEAG